MRAEPMDSGRTLSSAGVGFAFWVFPADPLPVRVFGLNVVDSEGQADSVERFRALLKFCSGDHFP